MSLEERIVQAVSKFTIYNTRIEIQVSEVLRSLSRHRFIFRVHVNHRKFTSSCFWSLCLDGNSR
jgi:hypothetical protein